MYRRSNEKKLTIIKEVKEGADWWAWGVRGRLLHSATLPFFLFFVFGLWKTESDLKFLDCFDKAWWVGPYSYGPLCLSLTFLRKIIILYIYNFELLFFIYNKNMLNLPFSYNNRKKKMSDTDF